MLMRQVIYKVKNLPYPPLQPVDDDVVGFVGDVERHQTQVGEIPEELRERKRKIR